MEQWWDPTTASWKDCEAVLFHCLGLWGKHRCTLSITVFHCLGLGEENVCVEGPAHQMFSISGATEHQVRPVSIFRL